MIPEWIKFRKKIFLLLFSDILIIASIFYLDNFFLTLINTSQVFFFILVWILTSYVIGRFTHHSQINIATISKDFVKVLVVCLFSLVLAKTPFLLFLDRNDNIFSNELILKILLISYSSNIIIKKLIRNSFSRKLWYLISDEDQILFLNNEEKFIKKNINVVNISPSVISSFKFTKADFGVIIPSYNFSSNMNEDNFILELQEKGISVLNILKWYEKFLFRFPPHLINKNDFLVNLPFNEYSVQTRLKRIGDLTFSFTLLFFTFPLIFFSCLAIFIEDRGPILYSQTRTGYKGKKFKIYKLRTMKVNAEEKGFQWSQKDDKRVTFIGKFLRSSRIDELPQLFSVISGEMSLIGPRPERPEFDKILEKNIDYYRLRHLMKPGISGWAQVNYAYGASISDSENKLSYDLYYLKNFSVWLDFLICIKTIKLVLNRKGSDPV